VINEQRLAGEILFSDGRRRRSHRHGRRHRRGWRGRIVGSWLRRGEAPRSCPAPPRCEALDQLRELRGVQVREFAPPVFGELDPQRAAEHLHALPHSPLLALPHSPIRRYTLSGFSAAQSAEMTRAIPVAKSTVLSCIVPKHGVRVLQLLLSCEVKQAAAR
jgi:hypothetical protein